MVIQTTDYELTLSERYWEADADEQAAQRAINEENMRAYLDKLGRSLGAREEPGANEARD